MRFGNIEIWEHTENDSKSPRRVHIVISGRVQGVGYRYFALNSANELGLAGWVRNRPDGSVEIEAEGSQAPLDSFVLRLHQGPKWSSVENVAVSQIEPKNEKKFEVVG